MSWRIAFRWLLVTFYTVAGVAHLNDPTPFLAITPGWVPFPREVILATGVCELLGAVGLIVPVASRWAGIMLALYALCVFPANIKHALDALDGTGIPPTSWWYHGPRLLLQPVIIWWALYVSGTTDWPFGRKAGRV